MSGHACVHEWVEAPAMRRHHGALQCSWLGSGCCWSSCAERRQRARGPHLRRPLARPHRRLQAAPGEPCTVPGAPGRRSAATGGWNGWVVHRTCRGERQRAAPAGGKAVLGRHRPIHQLGPSPAHPAADLALDAIFADSLLRLVVEGHDGADVWPRGCGGDRRRAGGQCKEEGESGAGHGAIAGAIGGL